MISDLAEIGMFDGDPAVNTAAEMPTISNIDITLNYISRDIDITLHNTPLRIDTTHSVPGKHFGDIPISARPLDLGMGVAVARRTVFRPSDEADFGKVADRVAAGNMALLNREFTPNDYLEQMRLRNAIATGALLTSGRHLQHGDMTQPERGIEVFTNCASSITSFAKFYLLLNGSGVGRAYDDSLSVVNWHNAPKLLMYISPEHPDYPHSIAAQCHLGIEMGVLAHGTTTDPDGIMRQWIADNFIADIDTIPSSAIYHCIDDSREGWAKALEILESMAFRSETNKTVVLDFSDVRRAGAPIGGMQNRPASGPISLMRAFFNLRNKVINSPLKMPLWEQALRIDHYFSIEVQVGGARRAARMATKSWYDPDILQFIRIKTEGGLWTANHSVMVDQIFWSLIKSPPTDELLSQRAHEVFDEATRCIYVNGEPGFINADALEDNRTNVARDRIIYEDGSDFHSTRYQVEEACDLLAELSRRSSVSRFPVTTNPCGEIVLHVMGGVCVIADFAPLLACPVDFDTFSPGNAPDDVNTLWDARIEDSIRLAARMLIRTNTMNALYGKEISRTNRIGIGPTGLHEYAWMRFGLDFNDLIDPEISASFWKKIKYFSDVAKDESNNYSIFLGLTRPVTVTTIKPAGSTSKLFGLTEGAHLPARRQYIRWVQFKGTQDPITNEWHPNSDPLLADYEANGYPIRSLKTFNGMSIVGFPTVPLLIRLAIGHRSVTASEATPIEQYRWLRLLEQYWIGTDQGNQVSYTMKVLTTHYDLEAFRTIVRDHQSTIRCCAILPSKPDTELGYEYLPEEEISLEKFVDIVKNIQDNTVHEEIDLVHLQCASGVCPI